MQFLTFDLWYERLCSGPVLPFQHRTLFCLHVFLSGWATTTGELLGP